MIRRRLTVIFGATLLGISSCFLTSAFGDELLHDAGSWLQVVAEGSMKFLDPSLEKGRIWLEGQSRFDDNWDHWYQGMIRAAAGYSLSDRATLWAGYTWLPTQNIGKPYISQQDVWPAFRYTWPTPIGTLTFRTMVQTNFLRGDQIRVRPRQMIKFMHPLEFEPRLSVIVWDEFFVRANTTQWGGESGFDQNRAFVGLGWTFNPNFRTEIGYMNQEVEDARHENATMRFLIMGSSFISL